MTDVLADEAARRLIAGDVVNGRQGLDETLFVEAGAGSGKTTSLVARVTALVRRGTPMPRIAAITFTEKAAAELRDRLRRSFDELLDDAPGDAVGDGVRILLGSDERQRVEQARDDLDMAAVGTLHAFARRLLAEHAIDAGLPPNLEVLDAVGSEIAFERQWSRDRLALLDDPSMARTLLFADELGLPVHAGPGSTTLRPLVQTFNENWDRLLDPTSVPWPEAPVRGLDDAADRLSLIVEDLARMADTCGDQSDKLVLAIREQVVPWLIAFRTAPDEGVQLQLLTAKKPTFKYGRTGRAPSWVEVPKQDVIARVLDLIELRTTLTREITDDVLHQLAVRIKQIVLAAAGARKADGRLQFHDLLVLARQMLTGDDGTMIRRSLRDRYTHLLLDEFQDTDPIQLDIARLIATDPDVHLDIRTLPQPDPGRLFFVGDPKQSIYRFRRADIGLYLDTAAAMSGPDGPLSLVTNFRSTPGVLAWINEVFGRLIQPQPRAQPAYVALAPAPKAANAPTGPAVTLVGVEPLASDAKAFDLRRAEAEQVADAVAAALIDRWDVRDDVTKEWRACRPSDIAILLPARTSLSMLEGALEDRGIAYRADASSLVYSTREVRDLIMTVRAIVDPADGLAVVSALRSSVFGCGDDDLATWKFRHGGRFDPTWPGGDDTSDGHPVGEALAYLGARRRELTRTTPAELLLKIATDRRLFELGMLHRRPRDVWRRLRFVIDQARLWSDTTGGGIGAYLDWARLQASDSIRVAESILPETDDDAVRIMTIHAAKGLEFPITVLSGMTTRLRNPGRGVQVSWVDGEPIGLKIRADLVTEHYEAFMAIDEQLDREERLRLLYVAATRAKDHLIVSVTRPDKPLTETPASAAQAFAWACLDAAAAQTTHIPSGRRLPLPPPPSAPAPFDPVEWADERRRVDTASSRPRTLSATAIQHDLAAAAAAVVPARVDEADDVLAGDQKQGRDLDLPSSLKGRYGTSVGRAVHAVLQTVDLDTGAGLGDIAAAQAAAEGVAMREAEVESLATAALTSPTVREAVTCDRWRETYVATTIGDRTIEGYIDLLYRRPDGSLVVVDYKTAGSLEDLDRRVLHYRGQGATYALMVEAATGQSVADVVFVFLNDDRAVDRRIDDLPAAVAEVRNLLETVA